MKLSPGGTCRWKGQGVIKQNTHLRRIRHSMMRHSSCTTRTPPRWGKKKTFHINDDAVVVNVRMAGSYRKKYFVHSHPPCSTSDSCHSPFAIGRTPPASLSMPLLSNTITSPVVRSCATNPREGGDCGLGHRRAPTTHIRVPREYRRMQQRRFHAAETPVHFTRYCRPRVRRHHSPHAPPRATQAQHPSRSPV